MRRRWLRWVAVCSLGSLSGWFVAYVAPVQASADTAAARSSGYRFRVAAVLGDPEPGGGTFINDFEPSAFNNAGKVAFTADVDTGGEGVFVEQRGKIVQLARTGMAAPGGFT